MSASLKSSKPAGPPGATVPRAIARAGRLTSGPRSWRFKEAADRALAGAALLVLSPLLLAIGIAVKLTSPGPVFYVQERTGQFEEPFRIKKFRTMIDGAENVGRGLWVSDDDERITSVGRLLRRTSLDELAQLFNVAAGEMSLIGPRPGLPDQSARYTSFQKRRLRFRPGITGWAQVNGRNAISWEKRIEHDVWYTRNWSLLLDLYIVLRTPWAMIDPVGVYGEDGSPKDLGEE